jgi:hypothetical protein
MVCQQHTVCLRRARVREMVHGMYEKIHSWPNGIYEVGLVIGKYEQKSKYRTTFVQLSLISAFIDM